MASWARVRQIFEEVVELTGSDRETRLYELCAADAEVRREVERLLAQDDSTVDVAIEAAPDVTFAAVDPARLRQVGSYAVVRVLGSGGMGTVFEARQESPARTVALKVLRTLVASENAHRRLEYEAETLGRLRHPNVAQIHESGTWADPDTGEEMPFFAMEFVAGARPLTAFAAARGLELRQRIELFLPVCDAVHHGHQQGVLHRDLKPQNILVGEDGLPKVIDFGIARATDMADDGRALRTMTGQVLGTPGYMSPEQLDGDPAKIDARADVYGLGATLYELLVGKPPHDKGTTSLGRFLQQVRETAPLRPSAVAGPVVEVPAELDWVLLRALAAEPAERYASVSELAADLRRFLCDEPLVARPPTRGYLLRKFVRRHRLPVLAGSAVMVALVGGTIATSLGWQSALVAEDLADNRRVIAEQLADELWYLTELQTEILKGSRGDKNALLVDVLDRASRRLRQTPPTNDRVAAGLHNALGSAFLDLGLNDRSKEHFEAALARIDDGPAMLRTAIRVRGDYSALLYQLGKLEEAEEIRRTTLRHKSELYGDDHWRTAWGRVQLAVVLHERGQYQDAVELVHRALPVIRSDAAVEPRMIVSAVTQLANSSSRTGQKAAAAGHYDEARALAEREFGAEDPETLKIRNSQAALLMDTNRLAEAEVAFRELWDINRRVRGETHRSTLHAATNLALCAEKREAYAEAEPIYREVLRLRRDAKIPLEASDLITRFNLCVALHRQEGEQKLADALSELDTLVADAGRMLPADNWRLAVFRQHRGIALRKSGRFAEAEAEFAAVRPVLEKRLGPSNPRTRSNYEETARLYEAWGESDEAAKWRAKLGDR